MSRALFDNGNNVGKDLTYGTDPGIWDLQAHYANAAAAGTALYVNRNYTQYGSSTYSSFPSSTTLTNTSGWGYSSNTDALTINVSGSGTYQLKSISRFAVYSSSPGSGTFYLRVISGSQTADASTIASQTITRTPLYTGSYYAEEFAFTTPPTLNKGSTYTVALGYGSGVSGYNTHYINSGASNSISTAYGTVTIGNVSSFNGSSPFNSNNGTGNAGGQIPIIGFIF